MLAVVQYMLSPTYQALANAIVIWYHRQHPWFQMDLPPYLQNPPEVVENEVRF